MTAHYNLTMGQNVGIVPHDRPPLDEVGEAPIVEHTEDNVIQFVLDSIFGHRGVYCSDGEFFWLNGNGEQRSDGTYIKPEKHKLEDWQKDFAARCDNEARQYGSYLSYTARDVLKVIAQLEGHAI